MYQQNVPTLNCHLSSLDLKISTKYIYVILCTENKHFTKFSISKKYLSDLFGLENRQLERHFKVLEKNNLIKRYYDTSDTGKRKIGNTLHLELTPPTLLGTEERIANDESQLSLTFSGTVAQKIETSYQGKKIVDVELSNVRSDSGHIVFDKYWVKQEDISDPNSIKVNFKASLKIITDTRLILVPVKYQHHA